MGVAIGHSRRSAEHLRSRHARAVLAECIEENVQFAGRPCLNFERPPIKIHRLSRPSRARRFFILLVDCRFRCTVCAAGCFAVNRHQTCRFTTQGDSKLVICDLPNRGRWLTIARLRRMLQCPLPLDTQRSSQPDSGVSVLVSPNPGSRSTIARLPSELQCPLPLDFQQPLRLDSDCQDLKYRQSKAADPPS